MAINSEQIFFQRANADGQLANEKMLNTANHQGNANENHKGIISHLLKDMVKKNTNDKHW